MSDTGNRVGTREVAGDASPTKSTTEGSVGVHPAITNLRDCQRQLDMDGCEVGVSRQALDETLALLNEALAELKWCFTGAGNMVRMARVIAKAEGRS